MNYLELRQRKFKLKKFLLIYLLILFNIETFTKPLYLPFCPKCGNRTKIVKDFDASQKHKCLSEECNFQFILEFDNEDEI
jgi:hypothetical protein